VHKLGILSHMFRCPLYENAYSPESMEGRVSRYPFPDHHPPPLPLLPLAVREMKAWLDGGDERIAIIHCKAGKVS
jgi:phosphatidylinositol-3,4,5-trisphosphate 3-phosphatase/dual-specificity protein phosphatase PTEN